MRDNVIPFPMRPRPVRAATVGSGGAVDHIDLAQRLADLADHWVVVRDGPEVRQDARLLAVVTAVHGAVKNLAAELGGRASFRTTAGGITVIVGQAALGWRTTARIAELGVPDGATADQISALLRSRVRASG